MQYISWGSNMLQHLLATYSGLSWKQMQYSEKMDENGIIFKHVESWRCIFLLKNSIKSTKQELEQLFTGCSIPPRNLRSFSMCFFKRWLIHFNMSYWFGRNCFWKQTLHFKCKFLRSYFPKSEYVYSLLKAQYSLKGAICNVYKKIFQNKIRAMIQP